MSTNGSVLRQRGLPTTNGGGGQHHVEDGLDEMDEQIRRKLRSRHTKTANNNNSKGTTERRCSGATRSSVHSSRRTNGGIVGTVGKEGCGMILAAYGLMVISLLVGLILLIVLFGSGSGSSSSSSSPSKTFFVEGSLLETTTKRRSPPQKRRLATPVTAEKTTATTITTPSFPAVFTTVPSIPIQEWQQLVGHERQKTNYGSNTTTAIQLHDIVDVIHVECPSKHCTIHVLIHSPEDLILESTIASPSGTSTSTLATKMSMISSFLSNLTYNHELTQSWVTPRKRQQEFFLQEQREGEDEQRRRRNNVVNVANGNSYTHIFGRECMLDYDGTIRWIEDLVNNPPSHLSISWTDIGDSFVKAFTSNINNGGSSGSSTLQGHDINVLKIELIDGYATNNQAPSSSTTTTTPTVPKAPMLIVTSTHPREYAPPELVRRWIESIVTESPPSANTISFLQHTTIHWVPYLNPDGRVLAETTQPLRRKNLNGQQSGSVACSSDLFGVDLNRNFPVAWDVPGGSSPLACSQVTRGQGPASEPETQALVSYAQSIFPQDQQAQSLYNAWSSLPNGLAGLNQWLGYDETTTSGVFVDVHSYGQLYVFPFGFDNQICPNDDGFQASMGKLEQMTGYKARGPSTNFYGAASGATDDFGYGMLGALSMTWEVGTGFAEECVDFEADVDANLNAFNYLASIAPRPFWLSKGPDITAFDLVPIDNTLSSAKTSLVSNQEPVNITSGINVSLFIECSDDALQAIGGATASQQTIVNIRLYANVNPVQALVDGTLSSLPSFSWGISDSDFSFSSTTTASVTTILPWDQLFNGLLGSQTGDHILYAQGMDTDGHLGPVSSVLIRIDTSSDATNGSSPPQQGVGDDDWIMDFVDDTGTEPTQRYDSLGPKTAPADDNDGETSGSTTSGAMSSAASMVAFDSRIHLAAMVSIVMGSSMIFGLA